MRGFFGTYGRLLIALALGLTVTGCFKKGKGKGERQTRPGSSGSIFDDGDKNQKPEETANGEDDPPPEMDPEAKAILAACFNIDVSEVQDVPGWTEKEAAKAAATELCAKLDKTGYKNGIAQTAEPVEID